MSRLRRHFLAGLATLLPLGLTVFAIWFLVSNLGRILRPLLVLAPWIQQLPGWVVTVAGFVGLVILTILIGALTSGIVGREFVRRLDRLFQRLPLAREIYGSARQLTDAVFVQRSSLRKAVLAEYPRPGVFAVGFLTSEERVILPDGRPALMVFFPTSPNPTSGWLALIPESDVRDAGMSIEEGLKFVVSGGLVRPGDFGRRPPAGN
ncbi:MAG: DUF502 domain-containing protein [candidate division WOR-3 bacterium]